MSCPTRRQLLAGAAALAASCAPARDDTSLSDDTVDTDLQDTDPPVPPWCQPVAGTEAEGANSWQKLLSWLEGLSATDLTTVAIGVASLVLIFGLKVMAPRLPGALILLVLGLAASIVLGLGERGVTLSGEVPRGLPTIAIPELDFVGENLAVIATAAVGLLLIGFSQTAGDARSFGSKHGDRVDIDQESVAQGAANIGSGLLQGIPVSTSLSASSLADSSGAKTQLASLTTGAGE